MTSSLEGMWRSQSRLILEMIDINISIQATFGLGIDPTKALASHNVASAISKCCFRRHNVRYPIYSMPMNLHMSLSFCTCEWCCTIHLKSSGGSEKLTLDDLLGLSSRNLHTRYKIFDRPYSVAHRLQSRYNSLVYLIINLRGIS